jgi:hypothetical protein
VTAKADTLTKAERRETDIDTPDYLCANVISALEAVPARMGCNPVLQNDDKMHEYGVNFAFGWLFPCTRAALARHNPFGHTFATTDAT